MGRSLSDTDYLLTSETNFGQQRRASVAVAAGLRGSASVDPDMRTGPAHTMDGSRFWIQR